MNMKDIFDPNNYTEEVMPLTTAFCRAINDLGNLDYISNKRKADHEKIKPLEKKFSESLSKEQQDMYFDITWAGAEDCGAAMNEYFNRGLKFGILLIKELLT